MYDDDRWSQNEITKYHLVNELKFKQIVNDLNFNQNSSFSLIPASALKYWLFFLQTKTISHLHNTIQTQTDYHENN